VAHIDHHADAVHFANDLLAKACNTTVFCLVTTAGQQALVVIGQLHDHKIQLTHHLDHADIIFDGGAVLSAEHNADFAQLLGQTDICSASNRHNEITVHLKVSVPLGNSHQGLTNLLMVHNGCMHHGDTTLMQLLEDVSIPVGILQTINDNQLFM
jgi:hypothetical protein